MEKSMEQACAPKTPVLTRHCKQLPGISRVTACSLSATQSDPLVFHTVLLHPCLAASFPYHHASIFVFSCTERSSDSSDIREHVSASNPSIRNPVLLLPCACRDAGRSATQATLQSYLMLSFLLDRLKTQTGTVRATEAPSEAQRQSMLSVTSPLLYLFCSSP